MKEKTKFILYLCRWQLSTPILAPVMGLFQNTPICWTGAIIANLIGGCIFYFVDKKIFIEKKKMFKERKVK